MLDHQIYGSVTVNAKWQIVLPIETRKKMDIKPWDQLIVVSRGESFVWLIKADTIWDFIDKMSKCAVQMENLGIDDSQKIKSDILKLEEYAANPVQLD